MATLPAVEEGLVLRGVVPVQTTTAAAVAHLQAVTEDQAVVVDVVGPADVVVMLVDVVATAVGRGQVRHGGVLGRGTHDVGTRNHVV